MGVMPASSGGRAAKLDAADQAKAEAEQASGPYKMADRLVYDDIIEPAELRDRILEGLELASLGARTRS
jgi:acetyl-CoA carboxylase carboxyltransferase component